MKKDFRSLKVQIKEICRKSEENSRIGILKRFNKRDQHNDHLQVETFNFFIPILTTS